MDRMYSHNPGSNALARAAEASVASFFVCLFNVYFVFERERERERQSVNRGGAEREGDTESEAGSRP